MIHPQLQRPQQEMEYKALYLLIWFQNSAFIAVLWIFMELICYVITANRQQPQPDAHKYKTCQNMNVW